MSSVASSTLSMTKIPLYNRLVFERRILFGCTVLIGINIILWFVSIATDHWYYVYNIPNNASMLITSNTGLWRMCRIEIFHHHRHKGAINMTVDIRERLNATASKIETCDFHSLLPPDEENELSDPAYDDKMMEFNATEVLFAILSLILIVMGFIFSIYTFLNPRYTFKRLAGCIHFLTAACMFVLIEVFTVSVSYAKENMKYNFPVGATYTYGFSLYIACYVFVIVVVSGCLFLLFSKKKKGDKALNEALSLADRPTIMGR